MKALQSGIAGLLLAACASSAIAAASAQPAALITMPAKDLRWQPVPGTQGAVSYANVKGEILGKGYYEAFVRFRAGTDNGLHTHSQVLATVVLKGTFYARIDNTLTEYPAGSYYQLPANLVHESGCKAGEDCLLFQWQPDHFDLVPVKP